MNTIQKYEAGEIARLTAERAVPEFVTRRYAARVGESGRRRA